ncbi:alpha/beta hydrolase [Intrasporangium sp. YIM S08009]|uniref:alpha/beta fold hydrolase n=1 Tax=Intrasporangium zincisolvens TaxID=3080018 RepID=UPI002B058340|nr:alpha/beta hydrolase [Intrasporangium sp. YIM S08009]
MVTTHGLRRLVLADGRRVDTWEGGDPSGRPVLHCHGTPGGRLQAALGDGAARRVGVRLVAASRPGYGGTTDTATTLTSVARDTVEVADLLGLEDIAVLGVSGGGPYALAVAAVAPDRVVAVGVVAGVGPLAELERASVDAEVAEHVRAGRVEDAVTRQDHLVGDGHGHRLGTFVAPELLEPWTPTGRPGVPAYRGAARDALAVGPGWDLDLAAVRAPVHLWYGDRDRAVPLAHGRWLHEHLPTSRLVVREGAGHLGTLVPHWAEVLATLRGPAR